MRAPAVGTLLALGQSRDGARGFDRLKEGFRGVSLWPNGYNPKAQRCADLDWLVPEYIGDAFSLELIQHCLSSGITESNHCVGKRR